MNENKLNIIEKLINDKKINEAQIELSKFTDLTTCDRKFAYAKLTSVKFVFAIEE